MINIYYTQKQPLRTKLQKYLILGTWQDLTPMLNLNQGEGGLDILINLNNIIYTLILDSTRSDDK